ncbi:hypothetical protein DFH08DRAFT_1085241 [Mycena albidolilacea]|uniref:Uncharacterized protein n=1 Tax=Mycena albidolilacea TaxID=1033008 RepID=A0AAD6ZJF6_9AGAR|nr:hypothetical protein DFH08DRAFT_1085241 [Mycena albidolilacea]
MMCSLASRIFRDVHGVSGEQRTSLAIRRQRFLHPSLSHNKFRTMSSPDIIDHLCQSESPRLQKLAATMESNSSTVKWGTVDVDVVIRNLCSCYPRQKARDNVMIEVGSQEDPVIGGQHKNARPTRYQRDPDAFVPYIKAALEPVSLPPTNPYLPTLPSVIPVKNSIRIFWRPRSPGLLAEWASIGLTLVQWSRRTTSVPTIRLTSQRSTACQHTREFFKVPTTQYDKSVRHTVVKEVLTKECPTHILHTQDTSADYVLLAASGAPPPHVAHPVAKSPPRSLPPPNSPYPAGPSACIHCSPPAPSSSRAQSHLPRPVPPPPAPTLRTVSARWHTHPTPSPHRRVLQSSQSK